jgi:hypothetical protein
MKRRIICDRTEPHCLKCHKKGLECTGIGIRYRFNDGIASRGQFKGKNRPLPGKQTRLRKEDGTPEVIPPAPKQLIWVGEGSSAYPHKETDEGLQVGLDSLDTACPNVEDVGNSSSETFELMSSEDTTVESTLVLYQPIEQLDAKTRFLFSHCNSPS